MYALRRLQCYFLTDLLFAFFCRAKFYLYWMQKLLTVFFWGMFISFLGTLPLGTLNITAMQIGLQESINNAFYFSFGCLLSEMIYVRLSLVGLHWIRKQVKLMKLMEWITLFIILALAAGSFIAASKAVAGEKNVLLNNHLPRFVLGIFLSAVNPVQIPFWLGWSTLLFQKGILKPVNTHYCFYITGIGVGTLLGYFIFIIGGRWIVEKITESQSYINWVIGGIFVLTAIIQFIKMMLRKDSVSKLQDRQ